MRRGVITLTALLLVLVLAVAVFAAGCGDLKDAAKATGSQTTAAAGTATTAAAGGTATTAAGATESTQAAAASTPADALKQAFANVPNMTSGSGTFNLSIAMNGDTSAMPAESAAMFKDPITVSGTIAASQNPMALDMTVDASFAGQKLPFGIKAVDGKAWVEMMNVWYEAPDQVKEAFSTATTASATTPSSILEILATAGVDPSTWLKDLKQVGEEDLNGTKTVHMSGTVDISAMITDVMKLSQDPNLQKMIPGAGSTTDSSTAVSMPSATELASVVEQMQSMFQNVTMDVWTTKDGNELRKIGFAAKIVPPADSSSSMGITDVALTGDFTITPTSGPITVTPPADPRPAAELETALGGLSGMFSGLLGGASGSLSTDTTTAP